MQASKDPLTFCSGGIDELELLMDGCLGASDGDSEYSEQSWVGRAEVEESR